MIVTLNRLKRAIAVKLNIRPSEAAELADRVLSYFGFGNVIIDNVVLPEDRKLFYRLHDVGLLQSYAESLVLQNGRSWRIFYWVISNDELKRTLSKKKKRTDTTYSELPPEYWARMRAS